MKTPIAARRGLTVALAGVGLLGIFGFAFLGTCDPEAGYETDISSFWTLVWILSSAAVGIAGGLHFAETTLTRILFSIGLGLIALIASLIFWVNICEGVRLDRF